MNDLSLYERIITLRNKYRNDNDYDFKREILLILMEKAFINDDLLPNILQFEFPYEEASSSKVRKIADFILEILQDLGLDNYLSCGSSLIKNKICVSFIKQ